MRELNDYELKNIQGGFLKLVMAKAMLGVGIGVSFVVGIINGYQNPLACNSK